MRLATPFALLALAAGALPAQQPTTAIPASQTTGAAKRPPIRQLGAVVGKSDEAFLNIMGVRALRDGRVLVNDPQGRRVVMFEPDLAKMTVVADSTSATANAYGGRFGGLLPFRGDSSLFVDPASLSMLVIDPQGKVGRVMSVPRSQDAFSLTGMASGIPGFDASGRLVYRLNPRFDFRGGMPGAAGTPPTMPDSAAIVRIDLATRAIDTVAMVRIQSPRMQVVNEGEGRIRMQSEINPLPVVDDWTVLSDGSIAIVRGRDYRVDIVRPDGSRVSAPKIPFEWQRLTDEDKVAFIDSVKAQRDRQLASGGPVGVPGGAMVQTQIREGGPAGAGGAGGARGGEGGTVRQETTRAAGQLMVGGGSMQMNFVQPSELPDYKPAFLPNSTRADLEGNLWVRTVPTRQIPGGPVYDVINGKGELIDRVQVPEGRQVVGFGADGSVYLTWRDGTKVTLERAKLR